VARPGSTRHSITAPTKAYALLVLRMHDGLIHNLYFLCHLIWVPFDLNVRAVRCWDICIYICLNMSCEMSVVLGWGRIPSRQKQHLVLRRKFPNLFSRSLPEGANGGNAWKCAFLHSLDSHSQPLHLIDTILVPKCSWHWDLPERVPSFMWVALRAEINWIKHTWCI